MKIIITFTKVQNKTKLEKKNEKNDRKVNENNGINGKLMELMEINNNWWKIMELVETFFNIRYHQT